MNRTHGNSNLRNPRNCDRQTTPRPNCFLRRIRRENLPRRQKILPKNRQMIRWNVVRKLLPRKAESPQPSGWSA